MMPEEHRELLRAQLRSKGTRNPAAMELYELSQLSGITMDPHVFEILLDLLRKNIPPDAIVEMLRSMCIPAYQRVHEQNLSQQQNASSTSVTGFAASSASSASLPLSSGAVRADHRLTSSSSVHTRSLQDRSGVSMRQTNRRSEFDLTRSAQTQSAGNRKRFSHK